MPPNPLGIPDDSPLLRPRGRAGWGVWVVAVVGFFLLMSAWALADPLISGPDEPAHLIRAEAIVRGELIGTPVSTTNIENPNTVVLVPGFLQQANAFRYWCFIFYVDTTANCAPSLAGPDHLVRATTYVGHYPPLYYAVVGLPSLAYPGRGGVFVMRLVSAFIGALLLGTALWLALRRSRLVALAVLVAATPTVIYYSGSVNPNGMEMTAAVCFWCAVLGLAMPGAVGDAGGLVAAGLVAAGAGGGGGGAGGGGAGMAVGGRVEVVVAAVSGSVLALARGLSPAWVVLAVGAAVLGADRGRVRELVRRRDVRVAGAVLAVAALAAVAWIVGEHGLDELGDPLFHVSNVTLLRRALDLTPHYLAEMVGMFGANNIPAPPFATTVVVASLALLAVAALSVGTWRQRRVLLALLVGIVAVPVVVDLVSGRHYGLIWQGRYTLAVGVGSPLFAGYVLAAWSERRRLGGGEFGGSGEVASARQSDGGAGAGAAGGSPQGADVSPQRADVSPQGADVSPQRADVSPQRADVSPQRADVSPQRADVSPQRAVERGVGRWTSWGRVSWVVLAVASLLAGAQFTSFLWDLRRFMVGADGPFSGVFGGIWHPPVDGFVLLIAAVCGLVLITGLLWWPRAQRAPLR